LSRRQRGDEGWGCLVVLIVVVALATIVDWLGKHPLALVPIAVVLVVAAVVLLVAIGFVAWLRKGDRLQAEVERWWGLVRRREAAEAAQRHRIEAMLHPDRVRDEIHYMSGPEFERFMADLLRQKGYQVEETPLSGDQGVDLVLPDLDGKRVVIQLKRWTGPVGNKAIQATFAGMAHYQADEGWVITTSTFTKSARELARSTSVRLIDRDELADWLEGLREEEEDTPD
jgi:predicted Mrr-cat superfamily restriction endonuclease